MKTKPTALGVHIFAGGFSIGVERHFDVLAHLERCTLGVKSWQKFRPGVPVHVDKTATWTDALKDVGRVDMVYGNPPCASWSMASVRMARRGDSLSGDWARDVVKVADGVGAPLAIIESVRGAYALGADTYRKIADEYGRTLSWVFVNAVDHGLPQNRPRVFMVFGSRGWDGSAGVFVPEWSAPERRTSALECLEGAPHDVPMDPACMRSSKKHGMTWRDVHACLPAIPAGKELRNINPAMVRPYSEAVANYLEQCPWPFGIHTPVRCHADDRPTSVVFGGAAKFVHPVEDRLLTMREVMRLQGYPDDYEMVEGGVMTNHQVLGKTVCPPVGEWIAAEAAAHLRGDRDVRYVKEDAFVCCTDKVKSLTAKPVGFSQAIREALVALPEAPQKASKADKPMSRSQARRRSVQRPAPQATAAARTAQPRPPAAPEWSPMDVMDFWEFAWERQAIWTAREKGHDRPWTADPVMRIRFFTNCFRELDPGTRVAFEIAGYAAAEKRPAWERLWNLVLYRRFNREDTWRDEIRYVRAAEGDLEETCAELKRRLDARRAAGGAVFTVAHQVNSLSGEGDLIERSLRVAAKSKDGMVKLVDELRTAPTIKEAYRLVSSGAGHGIASFLGWQLTLDATYGPDPLVTVPVDWGPVGAGARVGLIIHLNWPNYGIVSNGQSIGPEQTEQRQKFPMLPIIPAKELEPAMAAMVARQDEEFARRGLDFYAVAAPGHEKMTIASVEHTLCEWQKYISVAVGGPHNKRVFDKEGGRASAHAAAAPEPKESTGGSQTQSARPRARRVLLSENGGPMLPSKLDESQIKPEWLELPGPTALARILINEGKSDGEVLAATKATFGGRKDGPHLFTKTDLARLRARVERKAGV